MKLFVYPPAPYSRKTLLGAYEKGALFDREIIEPWDAGAKERLLRIHPVFSLPLLVPDDEPPMTESSIILEYFDLVFPTALPLIPRDPRSALRVRAFDRIADQLMTAATFLGFTFRKLAAERRNTPRIETTKASIDASFDLLERALGGRRFLTGDDFTLADVSCFAGVATLIADQSIEGTERWPELTRWRTDVATRPSWKRVLEDIAVTPALPWSLVDG